MKLTDNYISKIKHLDKNQFFSMPGVEGLTLQVYKFPSKSKTWFYQYRPKGKNPVRLKVGSYEELGINKAVTRAKKLSNDIFMGKDPYEIRKIFKGENTLGEQLIESYKSILTPVRYSPSTISTIKSIFSSYIFRKTKRIDIRELFNQLDNIQHIKVSSFLVLKQMLGAQYGSNTRF